jgi:hypothetical protein
MAGDNDVDDRLDDDRRFGREGLRPGAINIASAWEALNNIRTRILQRPYRPATAQFLQDWHDLRDEVKQLVLDLYQDQWRQEPEVEMIAAHARERQWTGAGFNGLRESHFKLAMFQRCLRRARRQHPTYADHPGCPNPTV